MYVQCTGLNVGDGRPEWGAIPGNFHYILSLGQIIHKENCNNNNQTTNKTMETRLTITVVTKKSDNGNEDMTVDAEFKGDRIDIAIAIAQLMKDNQEFKQIIDVANDIFNNHINK